MHFVGLGHSHVVALAKGAYALQAAGATILDAPLSCSFHYLYDPTMEPAFVDGPAGRALNPAIAAAAGQGDPAFLLMSIGGNEHNVLSIAQLSRSYDFILGENQSLPVDESQEIVPESVVRETLRGWMTDKTDVLQALRSTIGVPMIQVEPPPPLPREQVLAYPKEFFKSALDARKMSPDLLRHKMWRVQCALLRELCGQFGVLYLETLPQMIDEAGMLAKHAWGKDATHANDAYGEAMVAEALRRISANLASDR